MAQHLMLDLETMGVAKDSVILSMAAIKFDPNGDDRDSIKDLSNLKIFYKRIDPESCDRIGLTIDPSTIEWWARQSPEAQEEAFSPLDRISIEDAMTDLYQFGSGCSGYWSNGSIFDIAILETVCNKLKRGYPWKYWQILDTRTAYIIQDPELPDGLKHDPRFDCLRQIIGVQNVARKIGGFKNLRK